MNIIANGNNAIVIQPAISLLIKSYIDYENQSTDDIGKLFNKKNRRMV